MTAINAQRLREMKQAGEKIVCLTAYDASFARIVAAAGVEVILVGDSLGMVLHGESTTLQVTLDEMVYHTRHTAGAADPALVVADMPFMTFATPDRALDAAGRLIGEGGAHMVKLEGGAWLRDTVEILTTRGLPVCAHLGLTPQSVNKFGGYRVQGREPEAAKAMLEDARLLEQAGAGLLVLECVPASLAKRISTALEIPVIGIGAGPDCDGQVLVLHDILGVSGRELRMSRNFLEQGGSIQGAVRAYVDAVKSGSFPGPEHGFE